MNWDALLVMVICWGGLLGLGIATAYVFRLTAVGLSAALALGAWFVLTLAYAMPFGWSRWVGDAALLLLLSGGALVAVMRRRQQGAISLYYPPFDRVLLVVVLVGLAVPALILPVPLDTDAQGFGYLALTARLGGNLTNLAPFNPDIDYLYAPGFTVLVAYLSAWLNTPLHTTQFGAAAVLAWLLVVALYDFGKIIGGINRARASVLAAFVGAGLLTAYMDSHYTSVIGLFFGVAFLAWVWLILVEQRGGQVVIFAALCLAALVLVHPDTTIIVGLGFGAWLLLSPFGNPRPTLRRWLTAALGVPLMAFLLILPWLLSVLHLLGSDIDSPFARNPAYWRIVLSVPPEILYHGGVIGLVALLGAFIGLRRRSQAALLAVGWLVLILEFAAFGILEHVAPLLIAPIVRYDYPFSLAWHGPIVPYVLLGGVVIARIGAWGRDHFHRVFNERVGYLLLAALTIIIIAGGVLNRDLLALSKGRITFFGAFASTADVHAMTWLRENTPPDAYVLNFPGPQEGDWVPVISERRSVYYRPQPFFTREGGAWVENVLAETDEQLALRAFWDTPTDPAHVDLLRRYDIDYVIVPQVVGKPASFASHYRWRSPFTDLSIAPGALAATGYLTLVYDADGARVYRVG